MTDTQTSEWIEHDGGPMPVDAETLVIVRFRDGREELERQASKAIFWGDGSDVDSNWSHEAPSESDIVAYRVVKP